jgi:toxic protein SymE
MPAGSGEGGRMDDRKLTVYNGRGAFKKSPPQILLQGNWLEQAGFSAGDKITVKCQQGRLVITKNEPESDTEAENRQT